MNLDGTIVAEDLAVLILAAGKGTRMKSNLVKVLHPLMGQPLLAHVLNSARYLDPARTVVVVGRQAERVKEAVKGDDLIFVLQEEQLGTGHAVASARPVLADFQGTVLILSGDVPLLSPQTMLDFLAAHRQSRTPLSVLTVELPQPGSYGRVIRDDQGYLLRIVEARDAAPEELAVCEINTGIYAVDSKLLFEAVGDLKPENDQNEYYLTDMVDLTRRRGMLVAAILSPDPEEVLGINDRVELAQAEAILRSRTNYAWMRAGVTMIDPETVYIETTVKLAPDVTIWPNTLLLGRTSVGPEAVIGPNCQIINSVIGARVNIKHGSFIEGAEVPEDAVVGPLAVVGRK